MKNLCITCDNPFESKREAKFCSKSCQNKMWFKNNPEKRKLSDLKYTYKNRKRMQLNNKIWRQNNPELNKEITKKSKLKHIDNFNNYQKNYRSNPENKKKRADYSRRLYAEDEDFKILCKLRARMNLALKHQDSPKYYRTFELIGCTPEFLNLYLKKNYMEKNNILTDEEFNNHKKEHKLEIDHIKDVSLFNLKDKEEQLKCSHYTNLQYLPRKDNQRKLKHFTKYTLPAQVSENNVI